MSDRSDTRPGILPCMAKPDVVDMGFGEESQRRDRDIELLEALTGPIAPKFVPGWMYGEPDVESVLSEDHYEAFTGMLERLRSGAQRTLTEKQRKWAESVADQLELDVGDPAQRNAGVPRGRPVEIAPVLKHLPKKPPGRK